MLIAEEYIDPYKFEHLLYVSISVSLRIFAVFFKSLLVWFPKSVLKLLHFVILANVLFNISDFSVT